MRISDWSSDVCSSDLQTLPVRLLDGSPDDPGDARRDEVDQPRIVGLADVMPVDRGELRHVEARGRSADAAQVEPFDRLFGRDDLVVAMTPAEATQVVAHGLRQEAHRSEAPRGGKG